MNLIQLIILIHLLFQVESADNTLELVHVIFRHCERTPTKLELYVKSPYNNESVFAPYGFGQLTNQGKKTCYDIGTALRNRYNLFLNASYHYTLVEGRSTHLNRAKESLQLVLAGLFPPTPELTWMEGFNWVPIATYYDKEGTEEIMYPVVTERYLTELLRFQETTEYDAFRAPFDELMKYVSQQIDEPVDFSRMMYIALGLQLMDQFGLEIPDWAKSIYPNETEDSVTSFTASIMGTMKLKRILGGFLFKKIIEDTDKKINQILDPQGRKIFIYSGHDITLSVFFSILDIWNRTTPPQGSYILIEVHNMNGTYGFKLFYQDYTTSDPRLLYLPGFGEFVPLGQLIKNKLEFLELSDLNEMSSSIKVPGSAVLTLSLLVIIFKI